MEESAQGKRIVFAVIILLLVVAGISSAKYIAVKNQLAVSEKVVTAYHYNDNALAFTKLFIEKVLEAKGEVSFEDRLQLENKVRDLNDKEISGAWNSFTKAETELQAQNAVKTLLKLLVGKVRAQ